MNTEPETNTVIETSVPTGAVLSLDSANAVEPTIDPSAFAKKEAAPGAFMSPAKVMRIIKKMVDSEQMTKAQGRQMRRQFGVTQSYFTGVKVSPEQQKAKRKLADVSRVKNRYNESSKGSKRTK